MEIIRYQVLIPVTEVQVRASSAKDMDSHFLWELIHLRSQLQRRSEKVYVLSNSTSDFRNAFLKTIRQIIRESVRNMSIPATKPGTGGGGGSAGGGLGLLAVSTPGAGPSGTSPASPSSHHTKPVHEQGSQTLGKQVKKQSSGKGGAAVQRHSAGTIDYDNLESGAVSEAEGSAKNLAPATSGFRSRSKTVSDALGEQRTPTTPCSLPSCHRHPVICLRAPS